MDTTTAALHTYPQQPPEAEQVKRPRKTSMRWVRFWHLEDRELFELREGMAAKVGICVASAAIPAGSAPRLVFVAPWTRVRSYRPVKGTKTEPVR